MLKPPGEYHSINTIHGKSRFGGGNRFSPKTIAKGHVNIQEDFAHIKAGQAVYDKQAHTFTVAGRVYSFHADHVVSGGTSSIYPIQGNPGDFVNVTQAEFDVLVVMTKSQGLKGDALRTLEGLRRSGNKGITADTDAKLVNLYTSRRP